MAVKAVCFLSTVTPVLFFLDVTIWELFFKLNNPGNSLPVILLTLIWSMLFIVQDITIITISFQHV